MSQEIDVSVYVPTYNHEKYLAQTLDGILMQHVNFKMEVLVADDASPDGTAEVMRRYEQAHPGFFTMIYREKNTYQNAELTMNAIDLLERCRGRYVIGVEGDDYWTDPDKLQKQFDFLEAHPEYIAVAHPSLVVGADSQPTGEHYPDCPDEEYTIQHFLDFVFPGQFATMMSRNYFRDPEIETDLLYKRLSPGDQLRIFLLCGYGRIYCMQETMSAYRHITSGGSSYSATFKFDFEKLYRFHLELMLYCLKIEKFPYKVKLASEVLYIGALFGGLKRKIITRKEFSKRYKLVRHRFRAMMRYIKFFLRKKLVKKIRKRDF